MKNLLLIFCTLVIIGCSNNVDVNNSIANTTNTQNNSNIEETPAKQNKAISPDGKFFESLTSDSNYFDVIKLVGTPDAETDLADLGLPMPVSLACYMKGMCIVFINKTPPFKKDLKSSYTYVGTIRVQPSEILHSADDKSLDFLEAIRTMVIKQYLEQVEESIK